MREEEGGLLAREAARLLLVPCPAAYPGGQERRLILPSVTEEGVVSLLSSEGLGPLGEPGVQHLCVLVVYNDMETHLCFLRNFSNVIAFNRIQCVPVSNNSVTLITVCLYLASSRTRVFAVL